MTGGDEDAERPERDVERIVRSARRRSEAAGRRTRSPLYGLGLFGLVGWAVALPTLGGVGLGVWIDARHPSEMSWTLALLLAGVALGCFNAWWWVRRESRDE